MSKKRKIEIEIAVQAINKSIKELEKQRDSLVALLPRREKNVRGFFVPPGSGGKIKFSKGGE